MNDQPQPSTPSTIASIMLRSADPVRLAAWYSSVLEIEFDEMVAEGCFGSLGTLQIGILPGPPALATAASRLALTYEVADFDRTAKMLAKIGTLAAADTIDTGQRMVFLRDPDGNELALVERR